MGLKLRDLKPIIFAAILLLLICVLSYIRMQKQNIWEHSIANMDMAIVAIYLFWLIIESVITGKAHNNREKTSDSGTLEFYAISQGLTFLSALWFKTMWTSPNMAHLAGFVIFISGVCLRFWAVATLGNYYSHIVRVVDEHRIIDTGPYKYIRHPAYTGMIMAHLGIVVFFVNPVTPMIFFIAFIPAIILRIFVEEKTLLKIDGYSQYAKNRKRLAPFIW